MMYINRLSAPLLLLTTVSAFSGPLTPLVTKHDVPRSSTRISLNKRNDDMLQNRIRVFGVAAAILAFNTATVSSAIAETPPVNEFIYSSSIHISETIKTMDFSMPSDYSSISDTKSSAGINMLSKEEDTITGKVVKKAPTPVKAAKAKPSDGGGVKTALTAEEREKLALQKSAEREAAAQEKAALEAEKRSEREALEAQKQADRKAQEAAREVERAQASAEKAEKQQAAKEAKAREDAGKAEKSEQKAKDKLYKGADFVEEGLPSYGF